MIRALFLTIAGTCLMASDHVAIWRHGSGTAGMQVLEIGDRITERQEVVGEPNRPTRLHFASATRSWVILGPSSRVQVYEEGSSIVIELLHGTCQVDVRDRGDYRTLLARMSTMEVEVHGTLFVMESYSRDREYVAMIHGQVRTRNRADMALGDRRRVDFEAIAGRPVQQLPEDGIPLGDRQGLLLDATTIRPVEDLRFRPQISRPDLPSIRDQGNGTGPGGTPWEQDDAAVLTDLFTDPLVRDLFDGNRGIIDPQQPAISTDRTRPVIPPGSPADLTNTDRPVIPPGQPVVQEIPQTNPEYDQRTIVDVVTLNVIDDTSRVVIEDVQTDIIDAVRDLGQLLPPAPPTGP